MRYLTSKERERRVNSTILDLRIALSNQTLTGERREAAKAELEALRLTRVGVRVRHQQEYLARLGITPGGRQPALLRRARAV